VVRSGFDAELRRGLIAYRAYSFLVSVGVVVVVGVLGSIWLVSQTGEDRRKLMELNEEKAELNEKVVSFRALLSDNFELQEEMAEAALPKVKPVFEVLSILTEVAGDTSVVVKELSSSPGNVASGSSQVVGSAKSSSRPKSNVKVDYEELDITLEISGNLQNVNDFLLELSQSLPLMDVEEIKISPRYVEGEEDTFEGEFNLMVYWMPEETVKVSGKLDAPSMMSSSQKQAFEQISLFRRYGK